MTKRSAVSYALVAALAFGLGFLFAPKVNPPAEATTSSETDPIIAVGEILQEPDPGLRAIGLAQFFASTDPEWAPRLYAEVFRARDRDLNHDEISEILFASFWARADPEAALKHTIPPAWADRHPWVRTVFTEWVDSDPKAALDAISRLPEPPSQGRVEAARFVLEGWLDHAELDPTPLFDVVRLLDTRARGIAIERILGSMIDQRGIDATIEFVDASTAPSEDGGESPLGVSVSRELIARMGVSLLDHDLARAVAWAEERGRSRETVGAIRHLAFYWARRDGPAAMTWVVGLPTFPEKPNVVRRTWSSFHRSQGEVARNWLEEQDPNTELAQVYGRYLRRIAKDNPGRALDLAQAVSDPAVRDQVVVAVGRGWIAADLTAAEAWMERENFPREKRELIRRALENTTSEPGRS